MNRFTFKRTAMLLPMGILCVAFSSPASAGWFSEPGTGVRKHIGSTPNPTPQDIRNYRAVQDRKAEERRAMVAAREEAAGTK